MSSEQGLGGDPGWSAVFRRDGTPANGITALRWLYLSLGMASISMLLVMFFVVTGDYEGPELGRTELWVIGLVATGALSIVVSAYFRNRPPDVEALASSYRVNFFAAFAAAEFPMLLGLAGALISGDLRIFLIGFFFFWFSYRRLAPTRAFLEMKQRQIMARGSTQSLVDALSGGR